MFQFTTQRPPTTYDIYGQPHATALAKHLRRGQPMTRRTRTDRLAAWLLVAGLGYLGYEILPAMIREIW